MNFNIKPVDPTTAFFEMSLSDWAISINQNISDLYSDGEDFIIKDGDYGFSAYLQILHSVLSSISINDVIRYTKRKLNIKKFIKAAHSGWIKNYIYWKNMDPNISSDECNDRATTNVDNLCNDDITMYKDIVNCIFDALASKAIESGLKSMTLS